jgi:hypothetical protein
VLIGEPASYAGGMADIKPRDTALAEWAGRVRAIVEAVYGSRFTLPRRGHRPTGTNVTVNQVLGLVAGQVVGVEAEAGPGADVQVHHYGDLR